MKVFRAEIHGQLIEIRVGDLGGRQVLVNGRMIADRPWAALSAKSDFFDITDEDETERHIEVRIFDRSKLGIGAYVAVISVDGRERCRLDAVDPDKPTDACTNCGYALRGLPVNAGEIRCPECGRHTPAVMLHRVDDEQTEKARGD